MKKTIRLFIFFVVIVFPIIVIAQSEDLVAYGKQIFDSECKSCHPSVSGHDKTVDLTKYSFEDLKNSKCGLVTKKNDRDIRALTEYFVSLRENK